MPKPAAKLLAWYDRHGRTLPWRVADPDPYRVWLSEIMLQQTTTTAVAPYYARFLARWPDVKALAAAEDAEVMQAWAGLGYYARARNLLACARTVAGEHAGRFPDSEAGLRALPGVGPYTAAAVAAIAFDRRAVVIDGNVERVVSRLFAIETPLPLSKADIRLRADELTPDERPGDFAQAMMDLGATICTPTRPACILCPLSSDCIARERGLQADLPRKMPKAARPSRIGAAFVGMREDGALLVRTRPAKGLLGGMTEFPGAWPVERGAPGDLLSAAPVTADWMEVGRAIHGFTHFDLELAVYRTRLPAHAGIEAPLRWCAPTLLHAEAFPTLMRKVAAAADVRLDDLSAGDGPELGRARPARAANGLRSQRLRSTRRERE